jgi:hypothetical protein
VDRTIVGPTVWKNQRWPLLSPPLGVDLHLELEQPPPKKVRRSESLFLPVVGRPVDDEDILRSTVVVPRLYSDRQPVIRVKPEHEKYDEGEGASVPSRQRGIYRAVSAGGRHTCIRDRRTM